MIDCLIKISPLNDFLASMEDFAIFLWSTSSLKENIEQFSDINMLFVLVCQLMMYKNKYKTRYEFYILIILK